MSIGATRNLTQQFIRLRTEAKRPQPAHEDRANVRLLAPEQPDGEAASASGQQPGWLPIAERVRADMTMLKERLVKLREYHGKALLVTFDTENETQQHLDALTREVQIIFKRLDKGIRSMEAGGDGKGEDPQVRLQVQRQLANALFKLSVEFRKEETRFLNKVEAQKGLAAGSSTGFVEADAAGASEMADPGFTAAQLAMVDMSSSVIEERDEEIRKIVETIADLAQIMRDLATLVIEQGTVLDRIDYNIQEVAAKVETGVKQLQSAEKTQKAGGMMLCIIGLIVAVVVMLILVIIRKSI